MGRLKLQPHRPRLRTFLLLVGATLAGSLASGCARIPPYQRGRLAHPTMLLADSTSPGEAHVYAIQEGSMGGASAAEGGCGCN
jgi:hypothetical protein